MKKHAEIIYEEIEQNSEYEEIINRVIDECFKNEGLDGFISYVRTRRNITND